MLFYNGWDDFAFSFFFSEQKILHQFIPSSMYVGFFLGHYYLVGSYLLFYTLCTNLFLSDSLHESGILNRFTLLSTSKPLSFGFVWILIGYRKRKGARISRCLSIQKTDTPILNWPPKKP